MRLRIHHDRVVVEIVSSPLSNMMLLERAEWDILTPNRETIEYHPTKPSTEPVEGDCVWVWVALKARTNAAAYATVKTFGQKVYVDLCDYWYPNGMEGSIAPTKRGVYLDLEGWLALVWEMDTIVEFWHNANNYLKIQSAIATNPRTLVDTSDEDSQLVVLDSTTLFITATQKLIFVLLDFSIYDTFVMWLVRIRSIRWFFLTSLHCLYQYQADLHTVSQVEQGNIVHWMTIFWDSHMNGIWYELLWLNDYSTFSYICFEYGRPDDNYRYYQFDGHILCQWYEKGTVIDMLISTCIY